MKRQGRSGPTGTLRHAAVLALGLLLFFPAVGRGRQPDVYVLLVDTLRRDHLGMYGYPRSTSPSLDHFAESALVFERATAPCSWTLPSVGSLFTGLYPTVHGLRDGARGPEAIRSLRPDVATLAEAMKEAGYFTGALITNAWMSAKTGLDRGFDHYRVFDRTIDAVKLNEFAKELVQENSDRPVFLYLHYMDVHQPYRVPEDAPAVSGPVKGLDQPLTAPLAEKFAQMLRKRPPPGAGDTVGYYIDAYDRGIREWDAAFGHWLDWLEESGRLDRSWVIVVSDHGEELFERGRFAHGTSLFQDQAIIPWVMRGPGGQPRGRVSARVNLVDLPATVLAAVGQKAPPTMRGDDVRQGAPERMLFAESGEADNRMRQRAVWVGHRKLVLDGGRSLTFDLETDPQEQSPLPADPELESALADWERDTQARAAALSESQSAPIDEATRERLRELGYLGGE